MHHDSLNITLEQILKLKGELMKRQSTQGLYVAGGCLKRTPACSSRRSKLATVVSALLIVAIAYGLMYTLMNAWDHEYEELYAPRMTVVGASSHALALPGGK